MNLKRFIEHILEDKTKTATKDKNTRDVSILEIGQRSNKGKKDVTNHYFQEAGDSTDEE